MTFSAFRRVAAVAALALAATGPVQAGTCEGKVVGVRPLAQYDHARGNGFLAVRAGPGSKYAQIGELYLGDWAGVWARAGNWYQVTCVSGQCVTPLWGEPTPDGWVYGKYLAIDGICDHLR